MKLRSFVVMIAVILAASSIVFCAEEIETSVEEVNKLLGGAKVIAEDGQLDVAEKILDDALKRFWALSDEDKMKTEWTFWRAPFKLAEKRTEKAQDAKGKLRALKWYEAHAVLRCYLDKLPGTSGPRPSFRDQQMKYAHVLGMALADCGNDADKVREKYPGIAESWAPLLAADLDGDGTKEFVSIAGRLPDPPAVNVFFAKGDGGMLCLQYELESTLSFVTASDEDKDGKDEIILQRGPEPGTIVLDFTQDDMDVYTEQIVAITVVKYKDGKLVKSDEKVETWEETGE